MSLQKDPFWILNANYLAPSMDFQQGNILIHHGIIKDIAQKEPTQKSVADVNAKGLIVLPGLINSHTHLPMVLFKGLGEGLPLSRWLHEIIFPLESQLEPHEVHISSLLAMAELIHSGCTCFADMYFFVEEIAKAVEIAGLRACLSLGITQSSGDEGLRKSEDFFRHYHLCCDGRLSVHLGPHAIYTCPPEYLKEIIQLSQQLQTTIHIHANETTEEVEQHLRKYGEYPIETFEKLGLLEQSVLMAHCVHINSTEFDIIRHAPNLLIAHNPTSNMKLASGISPLSRFIQNQIPVALGTDGAASNNSQNLFWELKIASLLAKVSQKDALAVNTKDAFRLVTENPGKFFGPKGLGKIQTNAPADLIFLDLNESHCLPHHDVLSNLVFSSKGSEVDSMMVAGNLIMQNKTILAFEEEKIRSEFNKISKKYA